MMDPTTLLLEELPERLDDLFGLKPVTKLERLPGGYKCDNFRLECGPDVLFLKMYKHRISHWIAQIKYAEQFFASHGLPVIAPLLDRHQRPMFMVEGQWYSLFPFVNAAQPVRGNIADATIASMGELLGRMHIVGKNVRADHFQQMHGWDRQAFRMEMVELRDLSARKRHPLHDRIRDTLEKKSRIVESTDLTPRGLDLRWDCLLHGDFIYQNTFVDETGQVTHMFDLEKTSVGPRAYELARSLLINCFDTAWEEDNVRQGKLFLSAYRSANPIDFDEFLNGMRMYMIGVAHSTWIEARLLLGTAEQHHHDLFESHALRIDHVTANPVELCEELYS